MDRRTYLLGSATVGISSVSGCVAFVDDFAAGASDGEDDDNVYTMRERFEIVEEGVALELVEMREIEARTLIEGASGDVQIYRFTLENVGNVRVSIPSGLSSFFQLSYDDALIEPDRGIATAPIEEGPRTTSVQLNPGVTKDVEIAFDIPTDAQLNYILVQAGGGFSGQPEEYRILLDELNQ